MPVVHETVVYDVQDCKVFALTADVGGNPSPTYGAAVDVPGIASVSLDPNLVTAELKGDGGTVLAKKGRVDKFSFSATYGKLDLDVLAVLLGYSVTDPSGNEARGDYSSGTVLPYFGLVASIQDVEIEQGIRDVHLILYKCQITGGTLFAGQTEQFGQPTFNAEVIRPVSMSRMMRLRFLDAVTPPTMM